ncbi:MAG: glycine--tRNA ligase [Candidatus Latescibacteria bacterium]|nr:glycine--tRNA ligase [Candidatus Latescibacterota bacterium]
MEKIVSLCKRRGFIFQSSEIYGGLNSCWDYGPLGVELKRNVKATWWNDVVRNREDIVGLDSSILMHPKVWEASGHVDSFSDPMVDCKACKKRFRFDDLEENVCPNCGGELTEPRQFNMMFKTFMGPVEDNSAVVYMRPETAQGIFVNFLNVQASMRMKLPFGIAQIGKSFRNEITPGNFIFRTREFEQMEIEYFVEPGTDEAWYETWIQERFDWYLRYGVRAEKLRLETHGEEDLAHYAKACTDIEYAFPFGWKELEGIANRTDYDLRQHAESSGKRLEFFNDQTHEKVVPYVIEPSGGVDRAVLVFLVDAFEEETVRGETRVVLRLHPKLAPIKAAIFPLVKRDGMPEKARQIVGMLQPHFAVFYDEGGSVGRRYRRMDEAGTPFGITVDSETLENDTVTVRDRDTMEQVRVKIAELRGHLAERIEGWTRSDNGNE